MTLEAAIALVEAAVADLNTALGLDAADYSNRVSFGYIGNLEERHDYRSWMVFLPHPGRVGTSADHIGSVATDDIDGFVSIAARVSALAVEAAGR